MRHRVKSIKFKYGRNANKMLTRKLLKNFVTNGRMTTTEKKIKLVKHQVEKLVQLAKKNTEASRLSLRSRLADKKIEDTLIRHVSPVFKDKPSGFTTLIRLSQRDSDGANIAKLQWSLPVVLEKPVKKEKKKIEVKAPASDKKTTKAKAEIKKNKKE